MNCLKCGKPIEILVKTDFGKFCNRICNSKYSKNEPIKGKIYEVSNVDIIIK